MSCGIYVIRCLVSGKVYVGSSVNCISRLRVHLLKLRRRKHINKYLQCSWDKHGEINFKFEMVEFCAKENLKDREQFYINLLKSGSRKCGFNQAPAVRQEMPAEQLSKTMRDYWEGLSEDERNARHEYKRTSEGRALLRQNVIDQWSDPIFRRLQPIKVSRTMKKICADPKVREQRKKISNAYWSTPEAKEKVRQRMLKFWAERKGTK